MSFMQVSPFTGRVFKRQLPARLAAAPVAYAAPVPMVASGPATAATKLPLDLRRIIRPEAQSRWMLPQVATVTPSYIESILRGALAGRHVEQWQLFDLMEDTWPRLVKNLNELKRAVLKLDWNLEAWAEDEEAASADAEERAKLVSSAVWNMRPDPATADAAFEGTIYDLLDAWAKGLSVCEINWQMRKAGKIGDITAPQSTFWVHPQNYAWGESGRLGLVQTAQTQGSFLQMASGTATVTDFPEDKFLISICKARTGHPLAGALLRPLAFWWCAANFSASWFLNFAQIFGIPIRWANYDPNTPGLLENVSDMLENMGSAAWGAFPAGTTLELKEPMKAGTDNPQVSLLDRADKNCDLLILGQTLTTDVGSSGSRALGDVHMTVREDIIQSAADFAAGIINQQLIPAILRLNYGDDDQAPYFCPEPKEQKDKKANAERDNLLLTQGVPMPRNWFYERHEIPIPQPGEEVITGRAQPAPGRQPAAGQSGDPQSAPGQSATQAHRITDPATIKVIDDALEELTGVEARWLGDVKPIFAELLAAGQSEAVSDEQLIQTLERAQKRMPELFTRLNAQALADALYNAMSAGVVNGAVRGFMIRKSGGAK